MEFLDDVASILDNKGHQVWAIGPDATVLEAIRLMADKNVGALLVLHEEELVGIISERDYTQKVILCGRSSHETPVRDIMSTKLVTVEPECMVEEALRIMTRRHVRHVPVVRDREVLGVISIGDLVEHVIREQRAALTQLEGYIIGRYPG